MKLIIFALIAYLIYILFFKKGGVISSNDKKDDDSETMVECEKCHTYISIKESIKENGKYYCSEECKRLT